MIIRDIILLMLIHFSSFGQGKVNYLTEELPSDSILKPSVENHSAIWPKVDRDVKFKRCLAVFPIGDIAYAFDKVSPSLFYFRQGLGVQTDLKISPKWYARVGYNFASFTNDTNYLDTRTYSYTRKQDKLPLSHNVLGRISYTPNHVIS